MLKLDGFTAIAASNWKKLEVMLVFGRPDKTWGVAGLSLMAVNYPS